MMPAEITVAELSTKRQDNSQPRQYVDVREPQELAIVRLDDFINLPLSEYADWSPEIYTRLDKDVETIVICHHGMRSMQMCQWLVTQGFTSVYNVRGGIDAYAVQIDPNLSQY
jgi:rhodanese-related sulfurtransferase